MNKKQSLVNKGINFLKQFMTYGFVAVIATIVDFTFLYTFTEYFGIYYLYSVALSYLIASVVNFLLQKKITFKCESDRYLTQFSAFFIIGIGGVSINLIVTFISVEYFGLWYMYGKAIATLIAFFWNFNVNKFFTFKHLK